MTEQNTAKASEAMMQKAALEANFTRRFMECMKAFEYFMEYTLRGREIYPVHAELIIPVIDEDAESKGIIRYSMTMTFNDEEHTKEAAQLTIPCWESIQDKIQKEEIRSGRKSDFTAKMGYMQFGKKLSIEFTIERNLIQSAASVPFLEAAK